MKIILYTLLFVMAMSVNSHEIELDNKTKEEIIDIRMKQMGNINILSQKIYKQLNSDNYDILKDNTLKLKHAAIHFQTLFPLNSQGGKAKKIIWEDKKLFNKYNDDFLYDINFMLVNIEGKNIESLKKSFNNMASNCSSCHKKFKNKK